MADHIIDLHTEKRNRSLENQRTAADPFRSAWVSANAGTGKTKVLTDRVIRLLLADTDPSRILCLTYTKAAASEMANRLFQRLGEWAVQTDDVLKKNIEDLVGEPVSRETLGPARRLFARALETPGGLKIQTIHAFAQAVLKRFPLEAAVSPHFEILDDRTSAELAFEARQNVFERIDQEPHTDLARAGKDLVARLNETTLDTVIKAVISAREQITDIMKSWGEVESYIDHLRSELGLGLEETEATIFENAVAAAGAKEESLKQAMEALVEGGTNDQKHAAILSAFLCSEDKEGAYGDYLTLFLTGTGAPRKKLVTNPIEKKFPGTEKILHDEQERVIASQQKMCAANAVAATQSLFVFANALIPELARLKSLSGKLDYDDLITSMAGLVSSPDAAWVQYKLDGGIDHILVDEAQDTSPAQWNIVKQLAAEFFYSSSAFEERDIELGRTIFAVGDEKQSIYSFQGVEPKQFGVERSHYEGYVTGAGRAFASVDLTLSFRSTREILKAVDSVFEPAEVLKGLNSTGEKIEHEAARVAAQGLVELWPTVPVEKGEDRDAWDAPLGRAATSSPRAVLAGRIADQIETWIGGQEPAIKGGKAITAGDIMILVRKRDTFVDEMIRALKQKGIPVAGRDRMVLTDQLAVMDLMAIGNFALLPEDDLTLGVVLKSPIIGLTEEELFDLAFERQGTLWQSLFEKRETSLKIAAAHRSLAAILARVETHPPYEFFARVLSTVGEDGGSGRQSFLRRLGPEAADPIDEFLNLALDYEGVEAPTLQGFLAWVQADASDIRREFDHEVNQVRVLTVHGSKGLQAPIVLLPDTCSMPSSRSDSKLVSFNGERGPYLLWRQSTNDEDERTKEVRQNLSVAREEEQRRLLYVAMTRARDRLYVSGYETGRKRPDGCWYELVEKAVKHQMSEEQSFWGETVWRLELPRIGDASPIEDSSEKTLIQANPPQELPLWVSKKIEVPEEPKQILAPSKLTGDEEVLVEDAPLSPIIEGGTDRFRRGSLIHKLLQYLPDVDAGARKDASRRYLELNAEDLSDGHREALIDEVFRVLTDSQFAPIFGLGSMAEAPLVGCLSGSDLELNGQIDRLLVTKDRVLVVDYKTNRPPPKIASEVSPLYIRQMAAYRALLQEICPDREVFCALLWTDGPTLMALPNEILDQEIVRIREIS